MGLNMGMGLGMGMGQGHELVVHTSRWVSWLESLILGS